LEANHRNQQYIRNHQYIYRQITQRPPKGGITSYCLPVLNDPNGISSSISDSRQITTKTSVARSGDFAPDLVIFALVWYLVIFFVICDKSGDFCTYMVGVGIR
jgi:hypothetical protein